MRSKWPVVFFVAFSGMLIGCGKQAAPSKTDPSTPIAERPPNRETPPSSPAIVAKQKPTEPVPVVEKLPDATMEESEAFKKVDVQYPGLFGGGSIRFENKHLTESGQLLPAILELVKKTPSITEISFQYAREFSDKGLADLKGLTNLRKLLIHGTKVTDEGMPNLKDMAKLEQIMLSGTEVTDKGLASLKGLKQLKEIDIGESYPPTITDAGLAELPLANLTRLQIGGTKITDAGFARLKGAKNLSVLWAKGTAITDQGLEHLKALKELSWLKLEYTPITDAGLVHLEGLSRLFSMDLTGTKVTKEAAEKFLVKIPKCRIEGTGWKLPPDK